MERAREKLHSSTGASMLIALLFFLVAMAVGAVVLTAASANAGRAERIRQEQQSYLAAASAAELVKEDIAGASFNASYEIYDITEVTEYFTYDEEGNLVNSSYSTKSYTNYGAGKAEMKESSLLSQMSNLLMSIYYASVSPSVPKEIWGGSENWQDWTPGTAAQRDLRFDATAAELPGVVGTITVVTAETDAKNRGRYTLVVTLKDEAGKNAMMLTFPAEVQKATYNDSSTTSTTDSTTNITTDITTDTTTVTTKVTWQAPVITKGAEP